MLDALSRSRRLVVALSVAVLLLTSAGCSRQETSSDGGVIFANNCARCHRADASGGFGPALGAGSRAVDLSDDELFQVIRNGRGSMPAWRALTDDQIRAVIGQLRALQGG